MIIIQLCFLVCVFWYSNAGSACSPASDCTSCMQTHISCRWCYKEDFDGPRCREVSDDLLAECAGSIFNIEPEIVENGKVYTVKNARNGFKGTWKHSHVMDYRHAEIFFLIDVSNTMKPVLNKVKANMFSLIDELKPYTVGENKFGSGAFVDKPVSPFCLDSKTQKCSDNVCAVSNNCKRPFALHLWKELMGNTQTLFPNYVSANYDVPEASLDALLQVVLCKKIIGWSDQATKLVLVFTDAPFHLAGDGIISGLLSPAPETCQLTEADDYMFTSAIYHDYPSVGRLSKALEAANLKTIFVVTENLEKHYEELASQLYLSSVSLINTTSTGTDLMKRIIERLKQSAFSVETKLVFSDKDVEVQLNLLMACSNNDDFKKRSSCTEVPRDEVVRWHLDYIYNGFSNVDIQIKSDLTDGYVIKFEYFHEECNCGTPSKSVCSGNGNYICNACVCNEGFSGSACKCDLSKLENTRVENCTNSCNDRGNCECGKCACTYPYYENDCSCSDFTCPSFQGELCNSHGKCVCGKCQCEDNWDKEDCSCDTATNNCVNPQFNTTCGGQGFCECNKCKCNAGSLYTGIFCDECIDQRSSSPCVPLSCQFVEECVKCLYTNGLNEGFSVEEKCASECNIAHIEDIVLRDYSETVSCRLIVNDDGCYIQYWPDFKNTKVIAIGNKLNCPEEINIWLIIIAVIIFVIFVGALVIIIVKIYGVVQDRREYYKFMEERNRLQFSDNKNPLYVEPTKKYINPLHGK